MSLGIWAAYPLCLKAERALTRYKRARRERGPSGRQTSMKATGQHTNHEQLHASQNAAEGYRAVADEHAQTLKDFWKRFMVSGLFVVAALVIIFACLPKSRLTSISVSIAIINLSSLAWLVSVGLFIGIFLELLTNLLL